MKEKSNDDEKCMRGATLPVFTDRDTQRPQQQQFNWDILSPNRIELADHRIKQFEPQFDL